MSFNRVAVAGISNLETSMNSGSRDPEAGPLPRQRGCRALKKGRGLIIRAGGNEDGSGSILADQRAAGKAAKGRYVKGMRAEGIKRLVKVGMAGFYGTWLLSSLRGC